MKKIILIFSFIIINLFPQQYHAVLYNGAGAAAQDKLLAMTLAGIVNRDSAKLFLLNVYETWSYNQTDEKWRDLYRSDGVVFDSVQSITTLVNKFRDKIEGGISYDASRFFSNFSGQSFRWQAEYAALIGGLTNRLPVTTAMAGTLNLLLSDSVLIVDDFDGDEPIYVTGRLENSSNPWNNNSLTEEERYLTMLNWGVENLLPRCNPNKFYIREITDFTIKEKMFQVNLAGTESLNFNSLPTPRADILENILLFMQTKNPSQIFHIYGWIRPEPLTQWFAHFGASFHETLLGNLSWHFSYPKERINYYPPSKNNLTSLQLEDKYYIIFVGSEGDASNWVFGFQSGAWLSNSRGEVPVGWGWNLHLLSLAPFVSNYYYQTATEKDGFVSVTSPLGYAYPDLWPNQFWGNAVDTTKKLMNFFGVEDIYGYKHYAPAGTITYRGKVINNSFNFTKYGQFQQAINAKLTMLFDPLVPNQIPFTHYGSLMFNHVNDGSFYGDASNLQNMANRILTSLKNKTKPYFLLAGYQRLRQEEFSSRPSPSNSDISLSRLKQVVDLINADNEIGQQIEVVTPEQFSYLIRLKLGLVNVENGININLPEEFSLSQNYPNPFNPSTIIEFNLPSPLKGEGSGVRYVSLKVYDILGNEIATLVNENQNAGKYSVNFDGRNLSSGIYFYQLVVSNNSITFTETKKMQLIK